jgi:hypothetical protein
LVSARLDWRHDLDENRRHRYWNGSLYVAGANDYNSYNGQGQDGFHWSATGTSWNDAGPVDVFPHNTNNVVGDPGLALGTDASGNAVAYYSSLFFNFHNCGVGGVDLTIGSYNQGINSWSSGTPVQFAANSRSQFQDKPAIALDQANGKVFVSWTHFGSCSGVNATSSSPPSLPRGPASTSPTARRTWTRAAKACAATTSTKRT